MILVLFCLLVALISKFALQLDQHQSVTFARDSIPTEATNLELFQQVSSDDVSACVRLLNRDGPIGCASEWHPRVLQAWTEARLASRSGVSGALYPILSDANLTNFIQNAPSGEYVLVVTSRLFSMLVRTKASR
jgi:hypothetical protein